MDKKPNELKEVNQEEKENEILEQVRIPEAAPKDELTEEQVEKIRKRAIKLLKKDKVLNGACSTMITAVRLYNTAMQAVNRQMDKLGETPSMESFITGSMRQNAMQPFKREELLESLNKNSVPWLLSEIHDQTQREAKQVASEIIAENEARKEQLISLPFTPAKDWSQVKTGSSGDVDVVSPGLGRERSLVFTGHSKAVAFVIGMIINKTQTEKDIMGDPRPSVMQLITTMKQHNVMNVRDQYLFQVGANRWAECGQSQKRIHETLDPFLVSMAGQHVDLLIINDMAVADKSTISVADASPWVAAGHCHRHLRKWADANSAAIVAGVPLESGKEKPVTAYRDDMKLTRQWDQLENYTDLVQLVVEVETPTTYTISAIQHDDLESEVVLARHVSRAF